MSKRRLTGREEIVGLAAANGDTIPLSVFSPTNPGAVRSVVLMGHGLGVDRYHDSMTAPMRVLLERHDMAVVAPDLPLHGVRDQPGSHPGEIVARWQSYWAGGGFTALVEEWSRILGFVETRFPGLAVGYYGLSLGTQYGIAFLADSDRVSGAVLGLFGSEPLPKSRVMNACAPRIRCPVYFVQKRDDEIHSRVSTDHLFALLGAEKVMDSTRGRHDDVSSDTVANACAFLAERML